MNHNRKAAASTGADSFAARAVEGRRAALEQLASANQEEQSRGSRAIVYLRVASAQDNYGMIDRQREGCRQIAERYGLTIVREYADIGRRARLDEQIELLRLLGDLSEKRDVEAVIVWDYARLGRSMEQLEQVIHHIHACGAEIVTITGVEAADRFMRERGSNSEPSPKEAGRA